MPGTGRLAGFAISIRVSFSAKPFDAGRVRERAIERDLVEGSRILLALLRNVPFAMIGPYTSARGSWSISSSGTNRGAQASNSSQLAAAFTQSTSSL